MIPLLAYLIVLFIYLIGMITVGFIFSTRTKNKDDFY